MTTQYKCRFLFTYGTLQPGYRDTNAYANFLYENSVANFNATVEGDLFDTGSFPGAKFNIKTGKHIAGTLFCIYEDYVEETMATLDVYEGVESGLYKRVIVECMIPGHDFPIEAWAYEFCGDLQPKEN